MRLAQMVGAAIPPLPLMPAERVLRQLYGGTFLTYADVFGEAIDLKTVQRWIAAIPAETVLSICSVLSRYASVRQARELSQGPLVAWAVSPLYAPDVLNMLRGGDQAPRQLLFHHEQLLLAAKLAILHGAGGPPAPADVGQRHEVGRILLAVNDLILSAGRDAAPESDAILGLVVRSLTINSVEEPRYQIARAYDMFVERAAANPEIGRFFHDEFGVELPDFMAFGLFCSLPVFPLQAPLPPVLDVANALQSGQFVPPRVQAHPDWAPALDQLVAPRDWFRAHLTDGKVGASTFHPFQLRPFFRSITGAIFPISHRFVLDRIGTGMLWMMHDAKRAKGRHGVQTFMGTLGTVCVEPHCVEALRDATPAGTGQLFLAGSDVPEYVSPGLGKVRGSDAYIADGERLVVIEITGSGVPISTLLSGDGAQFRVEFEKKMVMDSTPSGKPKPGKLGQLDRVVRDLLGGHLRLPGVDHSGIRTIYPVVLGLQPWALFPNVEAVITQMLDAHSMFAYPRGPIVVAPVRMITMEEVEIVAGDLAAGRARLADLLQGWLDDGLGRDSGFKNHLLRRGYQEQDNPRIHATYDRWAAGARETLVRSGLLDPDDPPPA